MDINFREWEQYTPLISLKYTNMQDKTEGKKKNLLTEKNSTHYGLAARPWSNSGIAASKIRNSYNDC